VTFEAKKISVAVGEKVVNKLEPTSSGREIPLGYPQSLFGLPRTHLGTEVFLCSQFLGTANNWFGVLAGSWGAGKFGLSTGALQETQSGTFQCEFTPSVGQDNEGEIRQSSYNRENKFT